MLDFNGALSLFLLGCLLLQSLPLRYKSIVFGEPYPQPPSLSPPTRSSSSFLSMPLPLSSIAASSSSPPSYLSSWTIRNVTHFCLLLLSLAITHVCSPSTFEPSLEDKFNTNLFILGWITAIGVVVIRVEGFVSPPSNGVVEEETGVVEGGGRNWSFWLEGVLAVAGFVGWGVTIFFASIDDGGSGPSPQVTSWVLSSVLATLLIVNLGSFSRSASLLLDSDDIGGEKAEEKATSEEDEEDEEEETLPEMVGRFFFLAMRVACCFLAGYAIGLGFESGAYSFLVPATLELLSIFLPTETNKPLHIAAASLVLLSQSFATVNYFVTQSRFFASLDDAASEALLDDGDAARLYSLSRFVLVWLAIRLLWIHYSKERKIVRGRGFVLEAVEQAELGWKDEKKVMGRKEVTSTTTGGGDLERKILRYLAFVL